MHINDSKVALNSHVDRHESLGRGLLGIDVFRCIMADARFENMPLVLEKPSGVIGLWTCVPISHKKDSR